jgi:hypothetical protein
MWLEEIILFQMRFSTIVFQTIFILGAYGWWYCLFVVSEMIHGVYIAVQLQYMSTLM